MKIDAREVSIKDGTILFFYDQERSKVKQVIPSGHWDSFEVLGEEYAIQLREPIKEPVITEKKEQSKKVRQESEKD